jgi:DNA (cytosine-5)-methyltransferase 1
MQPTFGLHGGMFDLGVHRPRLFQSNRLILASRQRSTRDPVAVYGDLDGRRIWTRRDGSEIRAACSLEQARDAMGIDWMTWDELREAIPPAYTDWVGCQLIVALGHEPRPWPLPDMPVPDMPAATSPGMQEERL